MIINGKAVAQRLRDEIATQVSQLKAEHGVTPGLAVVLVGEDPASQVYVRNKGKQTLEVGMQSFEFKLPEETTEAVLLAKVEELNNNPEVHGILVQMPLPSHIDEMRVINAIAPHKDVDGFHPVNTGLLNSGSDQGLVPCTPQGCLILLKRTLGDRLAGKNAVVVGRSNIVGKPVAALLLRESCTVTVAHSKTRDLREVCRNADILVAAVGRPEMIPGEWVKPGAVVIDVGINRIEGEGGKTRLVGDVDYASAHDVASAITPVPGGVGPMTIACLLQNTLIAAKRQHQID